MSEEPETQAENVFHRWHFVNKSNRAFLALSVIIVGFISAYIHFLPYLHLFLLLLITEDEWNWMLCSDCLLVPVTILHCITTFNGYIIYILRHVKEKKIIEIFKRLRYFWAFWDIMWAFSTAYEQADTGFWAIILSAVIILSIIIWVFTPLSESSAIHIGTKKQKKLITAHNICSSLSSTTTVSQSEWKLVHRHSSKKKVNYWSLNYCIISPERTVPNTFLSGTCYEESEIGYVWQDSNKHQESPKL